jgi:anhydro-N-acetylmuramic acid kinase
VALGGQGAPIVPFVHWFFTPAARAPRLVVNVGGICNITYVGRRAEDVIACDVGPGMMLSDAYAERATQGRLHFDRDGRLSRKGSVLPELVERVAAHPFVARPLPKSTGREEFGKVFYEPLFGAFRRAEPASVARSLLAATAEILHRTARRLGIVEGLREVLLSGGGANNPVLVEEVGKRFSPVPVRTATSGVFAPEHHEPAAMALIAARTLHGLPSSLVRVTGARAPAVLGHVHAPTE